MKEFVFFYLFENICGLYVEGIVVCYDYMVMDFNIDGCICNNDVLGDCKVCCVRIGR